jgi:predicted RNA-binding Zn-ribbon protein involved in translation (DUF1610 family)
MAVQVLRCAQCRREVLVRIDAPPGPDEVARRREEELRPTSRGPRGALAFAEQARDDIWLGVSGGRVEVPRAHAPDRCPACGHADLERTRVIE